MIAIVAHAEGSVISVRAQPGARRNTVVGEQNGALKVAVTAPPDRGRANDAIEEVLSAALGLKRSQVEIISGPTCRDKRFLLRGISLEVAEKRIQSILKPG